MKAVVMEVRGGYAAVLREDGTFEKIRRDCRVGETIELEEKRSGVMRFPGRATKWVAAAVAAVVLLSAGGTYGYNNAYAYSFVTIDTNPSIEYVLNRKNQVIDVQALNEDAAAVTEALSDAKRATLTEAIAATTDLLYEQEYLAADGEDCILINVSSRGEAQREELAAEVDAYFRGLGDSAPEVYMTNADEEQLAEAAAMGVSAGRYMLLRDIEEPDGVDIREEPVERLLERSGRRPERAAESFAAPDEVGPAEKTAEQKLPAGQELPTGQGLPTGQELPEEQEPSAGQGSAEDWGTASEPPASAESPASPESPASGDAGAGRNAPMGSTSAEKETQPGGASGEPSR